MACAIGFTSNVIPGVDVPVGQMQHIDTLTRRRRRCICPVRFWGEIRCFLDTDHGGLLTDRPEVVTEQLEVARRNTHLGEQLSIVCTQVRRTV